MKTTNPDVLTKAAEIYLQEYTKRQNSKYPLPAIGDNISNVADLCSKLIRFDTTNYGAGRSNGETAIAYYIYELLKNAGYKPLLLGRDINRLSVIVTAEGKNKNLKKMLVHAHTDVVPAEEEQWSTAPFSGEITEGYIYGRGAADMKDMVAMSLYTLLEWAKNSHHPKRDIIFAFVADEEDKGDWGAEWLVAEHADLFDNIAIAIGESGGIGEEIIHSDGKNKIRLYPIAAGERGTMHMRVHAFGDSGHGSRQNHNSAINKLIPKLQKIIEYKWPLQIGEIVRKYITETNNALGYDVDLSNEHGVSKAIKMMGSAGEVAKATIRVSSQVTVLKAGYKVNVVPGSASAEIDIRVLPGKEQEVEETIKSLLGEELEIEYISKQSPVASDINSEYYQAMEKSILKFDRNAIVVPYCMGGGTDAKAFNKLSIECFGFAPNTIDSEGRTISGVHGVDERIAISSIEGGQKILADFLVNT